MGFIEFEESVSFTEVFVAAWPNKCSFYTFPGAVFTAIIILIIAVMLWQAGTLIASGNVVDAIWVIIGTTIASLFTMYTNAYLKKGCEAANLIKKNNREFMSSPK